MDAGGTGIPALAVDRVEKRFGGVTAVDTVSLDIRQGEFVTLLGPSGCGKTTILRMVAGFETPSAGEIRIAGRSMTGVMPYNRPIGIVFQNLALFPHLTVEQNVAFGLEVRKVSRRETGERVAEALALVGLADFGARRVHQLSGGQRQRVALARALVIRPSVLLLDEPLGALDLKLRRQLQVELKRIQQQVGTTFVFVTHDQEEALTMSDRIAVMNRGRVEQYGTAAEVYDRPRTAFVAQFVGDTNFFEGRVLRVEGGTAEVALEGLGLTARAEAAGPVTPGQRVALSLRPENLRVGAAAAGLPCRLSGTVRESVYAGARIRYTLDVGAAGSAPRELTRHELTISVPAHPAAPDRYPAGHILEFGWDVADGIVVPTGLAMGDA